MTIMLKASTWLQGYLLITQTMTLVTFYREWDFHTGYKACVWKPENTHSIRESREVELTEVEAYQLLVLDSIDQVRQKVRDILYKDITG